MLSEAQFVEHVQTTAEFLNVRYFDGSLKFEVQMSNKVHGKKLAWVPATLSEARWKLGKPPLIVFSAAFQFSTLHEIESTLTHELLHVAQVILGLRVDHGKGFRELARRFNVPQEYTGRYAAQTVRHPKQMIRDHHRKEAARKQEANKDKKEEPCSDGTFRSLTRKM